jgi:SSS family transporter
VGFVTALDWLVLLSTLAGIAFYGWWKSRDVHDAATYVKSGDLKWPTIGLSIMATQASAITFLSTPGQAYEDGMRFVQFYFGLPLAMIVISAVFVPAYYRLKVFTAYEYLEHRFDVRVRVLGAILFLIQRGLAAGITIYAPAIILSAVLGWALEPTIAVLGLGVVGYTVSGGTRAVSITQKHQMVVMMGGMVVAAVVVVLRLPETVSMPAAVRLAGALDRMNVVSFALDWNNRYNFWSGIAGGFFLAMAYFGTDQSQVGRYLSGRSVAESRLGLLFNGMFKIPMQLLILFIGVMVFVFFLFTKPPIFFNQPTLERLAATKAAPALLELERRHDAAFEAQRQASTAFVTALDTPDEAAARATLREAAAEIRAVRVEARALIKAHLPDAETKDADYVFISFVLRYIPAGLVGLLIAVILCASMSSTASELTALGSTSMIDLYKRLRTGKAAVNLTGAGDLRLSKLFTAVWGLVAVGFATYASLVDNLIEAVNILGSIFYGTILGLFVTAFFVKRVTSTPVLIGALVAQTTVATLFFTSNLGFLWFNVIGCGLVVGVSLIAELVRGTFVRTA